MRGIISNISGIGCLMHVEVKYSLSRLAHADFDDDDDDDDDDDNDSNDDDDDDEEDDLVAACLSVLLPVLPQTGE